MKLADAIARLTRAGSEYSRTIDKLRTSVDELAAFLAKTLPQEGAVIKLPRGYVFQWWPSGEYFLMKKEQETTGVRVLIHLTRENKPRKELLDFAEEIAKGWFDEVAQFLEEEANKFETASISVGGSVSQIVSATKT